MQLLRAAIQKSRRLRSFTSGANCVKRRWRAAAINAPFFICEGMLETCLPFCSYSNSTWATRAANSTFSKALICMTFLHQRHFLSLLLCVPVALWQRGKACCLEKMSFSVCDKHFTGSLYTARGFLAGTQACCRCRWKYSPLRASVAQVTSQ